MITFLAVVVLLACGVFMVKSFMDDKDTSNTPPGFRFGGQPTPSDEPTKLPEAMLSAALVDAPAPAKRAVRKTAPKKTAAKKAPAKKKPIKNRK